MIPIIEQNFLSTELPPPSPPPPINRVSLSSTFSSFQVQARKHLGSDLVLYTTDGNSQQLLRCGKTAGAYATVDFGPGVDAEKAFHLQRLVEPRGPLVNSEYYPGNC